MKWSLILAMALSACGVGRILSGPEVSVPGVSVTPTMARIDLGELRVALELDNALAHDLTFAPHLVTLTGPDGSVYAESGGARTYVVATGRRRRIGLIFTDLDWKLEHAPGFYLNLVGFTGGALELPLDLPPLPLGHPVTEPDGRVRLRRVIASEP